jgi:ketosteroid isomerase-like protein
MSTVNNKQRIAQLWHAFATRDETLIASFFQDDAVWIAPANNATAVALGVTSGFTGAANIARFIAKDFGRLYADGVIVEFRGLYADGDTVITETRLRATLSNGRSYDNEYCFAFELSDGRVIAMREYMDTAKGYRMIFGEEAAQRFAAAFAELK